MRFNRVLFIVFIVFFNFTAVAQSLQDIQNLKTDDLSDAQIEQLIQRAESSGMNERQLEAMARERGMPANEVAKLRQRIEQLRSGRQQAYGQEQLGAQDQQRQVMWEDYSQDMFDSIRKSDPYYDLTPKQKKIFGFKLFHNRELSFNPSMNIPTPENYNIGAGDELLIDIYGASQQSYELTVNPEGMVFIPSVGPVQLAGLSIETARSQLKNSLSRIYAGLSDPNPNTFLQIRLGNIRSIQVNMVGELRKPGTYTLASFASVFNAMFAAGGPNVDGSFRHVQVYRNSELVGEVDLYEFLLRGGQENNVMLEDNDVVIVPPLRTRVEVEGAVRRPGLFEMKSNESLKDLIDFAGGFSDKAYQQSISVTRTTETEMKMDDIGKDFYDDFTPKNGDIFKVGEILKRYENRIQVTGAVFRPGEFALSEGMTLTDLIEKAGGLRGDAFTNRATLYRTRDNLKQEVLSFDLQRLLNGSVPDTELRREDVLHVPSIYDVKEELYINISGEVNRTGVYPYAENMTVGDLIIESKGFKESASNSFIEIARRTENDPDGQIAGIHIIEVDPGLKLKPEDEEFILEPFDHVFVRKSPGFQREKIVKVEGEVNYEGDFVIANNDERISDILKRAGGLNKFAYPKGATLIRRTENFNKLMNEERKMQTLQALLVRIQKEDSLGISETEMELMNRIEKRVVGLEEELAQEDQETEEEVLRKNRSQALEGLYADEDVALKETELVGIDLVSILENPGSKYDLILEEGDILSIPKELQTVRMRGEVLYPTTARYDDRRSFKNYISRAGGFSEEARKGRSYVVYANGDVKQTSTFLGIKFYPPIEPGAEIFVPKKPEKDPLPPQAWISIGSGLATMALVVIQIIGAL